MSSRGERSRGRGGFARRLLPGLLLVSAVVGAQLCLAQVDYTRQANVAPQPEDIGAEYQLPAVQRVPPRAEWQYLLDVALLTAALVVAGLINHRWRQRWMATVLTIVCLAYFGFYRQGCVCPVGSTQNVAAALADPTLAVPLAVLAFFLLPLVSALLVGRVFCGGVCPLGAIQDLVLLRPRQLPPDVDRWGGLLKYVYLAAAVWLAIQPVAERDLIICRFDPFVGMFRLTGTNWVLALGVILLAAGTVIGRPYCRFLCPYGGLLAIVSRFSWKRISITPGDELDCGLCAEACPFGAIHNLRADAASCLACARCFAHCPCQQLEWGEIELHELQLIASQAAQEPKP